MEYEREAEFHKNDGVHRGGNGGHSHRDGHRPLSPARRNPPHLRVSSAVVDPHERDRVLHATLREKRAMFLGLSLYVHRVDSLLLSDRSSSHGPR